MSERRREHVQLQSSAIRSLDYDPESRLLTITFTNGSTETVSADYETFKAFASAPSAGGFYHSNIRGRR